MPDSVNFPGAIIGLINNTLYQYPFDALVNIRVTFLPANCGDNTAVDLCTDRMRSFVNGDYTQMIPVVFISLWQRPQTCLAQTITPLIYLTCYD